MAEGENTISHSELAENLRRALSREDREKAQVVLSSLMDADAADVLSLLPNENLAEAFLLLPVGRAATVATHLRQELRESLWRGLDDGKLTEILNEMSPDDRSHLLEAVHPDRMAALLTRMNPRDRKETQVLFSYPPESVGRLMTPNYVRVRPAWTMEKVLEHVRKYGEAAETLEVLFVIDEDGRLIDDVDMRAVLLTPLDRQVESLMDREYLSLKAEEDRENAVRMMDRYDRSVLPVIDGENRLLGVVTFDDIWDVAEAEASEDIEKLSAMGALGDRYSGVSVLKLFRKRVVWLVALFIGGLLTVLAMGTFQEKIEEQAILALFVPLIIASGGNTGTQTASLMIRALALNDVGLQDWWRVMRRELLSGVLLASVLGTLGFFTGTAASMIFAESGIAAQQPFTMGIAIGIAVGSVVICGALIGSMLPFLFGKIGIDPATSSTPAVATILDFTGLVVYFVSASMIIGL